MLEVLRYIAYIALNACVKYCTKDQSNVEDVEGTLFEDGVCGFYLTLYTEYRSDVEGVKDSGYSGLSILQVYLIYLWHLWHALIYTVFDGMVEKL